MAKQRKIGAIIALDGEREFKTAVTSCNSVFIISNISKQFIQRSPS